MASSTTQTSKTILQLARLEARDNYPDSLNASPRQETQTSKMEDADRLQFIRKNNLLKIISDCKLKQSVHAKKEKADVCMKKSLMQVFLEKKRRTVQQNVRPSYASTSFLSQRADCLPGPSKAMTAQTMPQLGGSSSHRDHYKKSTRFTVKNVRESDREENLASCSTIRRFAQRKCTNTAELGDIAHKTVGLYANPRQRRVEQKRRDSSFMNATFASQQRTQDQVNSNISFNI